MGRRSAYNVAEAIGVAASTIKNWRAGKSEPSVSNLAALAEFLGVSLEWLATGRGASRGDGPASAAAAGAVDAVLLAQLIDGIAAIYRRHRVELPPAQQARVAAARYAEVVSVSIDPVERRGAFKMALHQIERDLLTENGSPGPNPRRT